MSAYRTESVVRVDFALDSGDFAKAHRDVQTRSRIQLIVFTIVALVGLCAGGFVWRFGAVQGLVLGGNLTVLASIILFLILRPNPVARFGDRWEDIRHQRLEATDEYFELADRTSQKRMAWELVVHWTEASAHFLVYIAPTSYHLIPKRAFASPETETAFRRLLEDRVPSGGAARLSAASRGTWPQIVFMLAVLVLLLGSVLEAAALALMS